MSKNYVEKSILEERRDHFYHKMTELASYIDANYPKGAKPPVGMVLELSALVKQYVEYKVACERYVYE